jgi:rhodanese-related sulfurtransferase
MAHESYPGNPENIHRCVLDQLAEAREKLPRRLTPAEAFMEMVAGEAKIIDIRYLEQRMTDGDIPGAILINRNEFEWRCDPASEWRDENIIPYDYEQQLIIICNQGYQSSLAAANLQDFGMQNVTDVDGGFTAWKASGQPWIPYEQ